MNGKVKKEILRTNIILKLPLKLSQEIMTRNIPKKLELKKKKAEIGPTLLVQK